MKVKMLQSIDGAWNGFTVQRFPEGKILEVPADEAPRSLELAAMLIRERLAVEVSDADEAVAKQAEAKAAADAEAKRLADEAAKRKAAEAKRLEKAKKIVEGAGKSAPAPVPAPKSTAPQG